MEKFKGSNPPSFLWMRFIKGITYVKFHAIWSIFRGRTKHQNISQRRNVLFFLPISVHMSARLGSITLKDTMKQGTFGVNVQLQR